MNKTLTTILCLFALTASHAASQETPTIEPYVKFLNQNVINRTLSKEGSGKSVDGKRDYTYRRDQTFCNLFRSGETLLFDEISIIKHRVWDLDDQGKRIGDGESKDRILVMRFEVRYKQSTNSLVGFSRIVSSTIDDGQASANEVTLRLYGNSLNMDEKTVGYDDSQSADGQLYERVSKTRKQLRLENQKLVVETIQSKTIRLHPKTGEVVESIDDPLPQDDVQSAILPR